MNAPVTVRDYLRLFFRRKYAIVAPILCSVFLILPIWKVVPEKYRATALVKRKDLALTNAAAGSLMVRDNGPVPVETMRAEILTWTNLDRVDQTTQAGRGSQDRRPTGRTNTRSSRTPSRSKRPRKGAGWT